MKTKQIILSCFFGIFLSVFAFAQNDSIPIKSIKANHFSVGFQLSHYQNDFGVGIHLTSPYIIQQMAFRLRGNVQFVGQTWLPYGNIQLSFINRFPILKNKIYVYGEGGGGIIIANSSASHDRFYGSGFGMFGVEFTPLPFMGYYFEMGGMGTAARTTSGNSYSNGFILNTAMRFYF
jgi:hypothetical protein